MIKSFIFFLNNILIINSLINCMLIKDTRLPLLIEENGGWSCPPKYPDKPFTSIDLPIQCKENDPDEYYYGKVFAKASPKSIKNKDKIKMESSCRQAAQFLIRSDFIKVEPYLCSFRIPSPIEPYPNLSKYIEKETKIYFCCPINPQTEKCDNPEIGDWSNCECYGYLKYPGGAKAFNKIVFETWCTDE